MSATRTLGEFANELLTKLAQICAKGEEFKNDDDGLIQLYFNLQKQNARKFLSSYKDSTVPLTSNSVSSFSVWLTASARIIDTDANLVCNLNANMNRFYWEMAEKVSQVMGINIYKLIFPTLTRYDGINKLPNKYIISDNLETLIDVEECFKNAIDNKDKIFRQTSPLNNEYIPLTKQEIARLRSFNSYAVTLYSDIENNRPTVYSFRTFQEKLSNKYLPVSSSYGEAGKQRFKAILGNELTLLDIPDLITTLESIPLVKIATVLECMSREDLQEKFMLDGRLHPALDQAMKDNVNDERKCLVLLLIKASVYLIIRPQQYSHIPEDKSPGFYSYFQGVKNYAASWMKKYDSKHKTDGLSILFDWLCQDKRDNFDQFFITKFMAKFADKYQADTAKEMQICKDALMQENSDTGELYKFAMQLAKPENTVQSRVINI